MKQLAVLHRTRYRFSKPLTDAIQLLRLTPLSCTSQTVLDWRIDVDCDARLREARDGYGNVVHMLYVNRPVTELAITATGRVITEDRAGVIEGIPGDLPREVFLRATRLTQADEALASLAAELVAGHLEPLPRLHFLSQTIYQQIAFDPASTDATTPAAEAFAQGRGVCQDFAHIFVTVARLAGHPARYISGHLLGRDANAGQSASHAWAEAHVSDLGWVAFDPANGICADDSYVRIAAGLDYHDAAPIAGTRRGGGSEEMIVEVQVSEVARRSPGQSQRQADAEDRGSQDQWGR